MTLSKPKTFWTCLVLFIVGAVINGEYPLVQLS
jgi:hypothetical protein